MSNANPVEPLYRRIKTEIRQRIYNGDWKIGDQVPTEQELVKQMQASRMTVNRALRELTQEGLLRRQQGSGTFVAPPKIEADFLEIKNIADEITARGHVHSSKVILLEQLPAPKNVSQALRLPDQTSLYHSLCLHFENDRPVQLEDRYVNPEIVPGFLNQDFSKITTGGYLLDTVPYNQAEHHISALPPTARLQKYLELADGEPVLLLERHTFSANKPVTTVKLYHPGGRFQLGGSVKRD